MTGATNGSITPLCIAVKGEVFDVAKAAALFGPEGSYSLLGGHDCSRNLAKMSFCTSDLDQMKWDDLSPAHAAALENWLEKCRRDYPYLGRLVSPPEPRVFSSPSELKQFDGSGPVPEGYAAAPIYMALNGTVFDVSFGGTTLYAPGGTYHGLVGRDATVLLGKMRLSPRDDDDIASLAADELAVVRDWERAFRDDRLYPVVGTLEPPSAEAASAATHWPLGAL